MCGPVSGPPVWSVGASVDGYTHLHAHMRLAVLADENLVASEVNLRTTTPDTCISTISKSLGLMAGRASRLSLPHSFWPKNSFAASV
jgi:hypothetical protein